MLGQSTSQLWKHYFQVGKTHLCWIKRGIIKTQVFIDSRVKLLVWLFDSEVTASIYKCMSVLNVLFLKSVSVATKIWMHGVTTLLSHSECFCSHSFITKLWQGNSGGMGVCFKSHFYSHQLSLIPSWEAAGHRQGWSLRRRVWGP